MAKEKSAEAPKRVKVTKTIILKKDELVGKIAEETGSTKVDTAKFIDAYPKVVLEALKENAPTKKEEVSAITLPGFGTCAAKFKPAYERTDNRTGEKITVKEHIVPTIKMSRTFKVGLNQAFFEEKGTKPKVEKKEKKGKSA